ncbi:GCR1-dependent translation factor 1 [Neonectria punicea]|uniref:GCR1-dependent translation factor 1 n=1 Tax=Neonectria punicea TaxID=979145 RepID=A0ABR1HE13_9HYPO
MKFQTSHSALLLLLLPAIVNAATSFPQDPAPVAPLDSIEPVVPPSAKRHGVPTKDAPVDGKDGKPHLGPFVDTDGVKRIPETDQKSLPPLEGRPDDPTIVDGKKIPETNDGVMFDKNRAYAEEGTTGLEGGMTEKSKAKQAEEDRTGEKAVTQPPPPKEQPLLPLGEEKKINEVSEKEVPKASEKDDDTGFTGLDKPNDLPERPDEQLPPIPDSVNKNHLDVSKGSSSTGKASGDHDDEEGIIQPFHSFILSFTMIIFSEIGDKTFLVAALMAMKHDRMVVFTAAGGALVVMTVLSAVMGHAVPALLPKRLTSFLAAILFFVFGAKLMREGLQMDPNEGVSAEMHEVEQELAQKEKEMGRKRGDSVDAYTLEMGLNGRRSRTNNRLISPPRSPSQSPVRGSSNGSGALSSLLHGTNNLLSLLLSPAWVQTFVMTFLGEWGDRSQIATVAMAAGQDYWWVTLGATVGHLLCTSIAVIGGRAIAGRVSLKVVTVGGAASFLLFGFIYLLEAIYS